MLVRVYGCVYIHDVNMTFSFKRFLAVCCEVIGIYVR